MTANRRIAGCRGRPSGSFRQRGMGYAAVMAVGMLVTVIGLAALMAARIGLRESNLQIEAVQADTVARTGLELVVLRLNQSCTWRSTYTHNTWTADEQCGGYPLAFKLVDETDGVFTDDVTDPVRIYTRSIVGSATRIYSAVLMIDNVEDQNLLANADMEGGINGWKSQATGTLYAESNNPHGGKYNVRSKGGSTYTVGVYQDVTSQVQNNSTYYLAAWVRGEQLSGTKKLVLIVTTSTGVSTYSVSANWTLPTWTQMSGTIQTAWSGNLISAYWGVEGTLVTLLSGDIHVDDSLFVRGTTAAGSPQLFVRRGSVRREVLP